MTLIHNNQVKEIRLEQFPEVLLVIISHQLLVQREIYLVGCDGIGVVIFDIDFVNGFLQRGKVLLDGLIHQHIAVCQVENFVDSFTL